MRLIVDAPGQYANAQLNGSECIVDTTFDQGRGAETILNVLLLNGPESGRFWQLAKSHVRPMTAAEQLEAVSA